MPDGQRVNSMTYPEKLAAISAQYQRNLILGRSYALTELRQALNSTSNEALQEQQAMREDA